MFWPSVFLKALRDQRWMILGFGVGGGAMAAYVLALYPAYRTALENFKVPPALKALFGNVDLTTAAGFVSTEFFSWIPALMVIYAIVQGTGVLAGEESAGTLDLLLACPIARTRLFLEKALATVAGIVAIVALTVVGFLIGYATGGVDISLGRLLLADVMLIPLTAAFAGVALAAAALFPTRRHALAALTILAVASYFVNSLGQVVSQLDPVRAVSLFAYLDAGEVLTEGLSWLDAVVLISVATLSMALAAVLFQRRDIGVTSTSGISLRGIRRLLPAKS
jgi:ABC-2 type transport system permease protein